MCFLADNSSRSSTDYVGIDSYAKLTQFKLVELRKQNWYTLLYMYDVILQVACDGNQFSGCGRHDNIDCGGGGRECNFLSPPARQILTTWERQGCLQLIAAVNLVWASSCLFPCLFISAFPLALRHSSTQTATISTSGWRSSESRT